jgi:DNA-binding Lrp family transcriptional regulator
MDTIDTALLNLLQADSSQTADQLATQVGLSPPAISRRLRRLRSGGIIEREVALLSRRLRERRVTAIIQLQLERHTPSEIADLKRLLAEMAEVQICFEITGTTDMLIIVSARDLADFNAIADGIGEQPLVKRYETSFVKRQIKVSLMVPLNEEDT